MREKLRVLLNRDPFLPFRIFVSDGKEYEIRQAESAMVEQSTITIVYPVVSSPADAIQHDVTIALIHVTRVEQFLPIEL